MSSGTRRAIAGASLRRGDWAYSAATRADRTVRLHVIRRPIGPSPFLDQHTITAAHASLGSDAAYPLVVVATIAGQPVGWATVTDCSWDVEASVLDEVVVLEPFRRRGIAGDLMRRLAHLETTLGRERIWTVPVGDDWDRLDFYAPLGFEMWDDASEPSVAVADLATLSAIVNTTPSLP